MSINSEYRIDVIESFKTLKIALENLSHHMHIDQSLPAWFNPPEDLPLFPDLNVREQALTLIQQLEYLDHQKPREILVGSGLIAASEKTIEAIINLNSCKDNFKKAIIALKNSDIKINDIELNQHLENILTERKNFETRVSEKRNPEIRNSEKINHERSNVITDTLKRFGLSRLHLKQCYRRLPFFTERPKKVSWTWANTRAITKITIDEARQMLQKQGNDFNIQNQLHKLNALNPKEPLAIVQELAPHLRANVVFRTNKDEEKRIMVKGPVPMFYLSKENDPLPEIKPPGQKRKRDKERSIRSDVKLNPEPFLPSIRVHRYFFN